MQNDDTNEIDVEEIEVEGETMKEKLAKLQKELAETRTERNEHLTGWQRAKADLINARKENAEQLVAQRRIIGREILINLLPALDSFDAAMQSANWNSVEATWRAGVEGIYAQLLSGLNEIGAEPFDPTGATLDIEKHEPVQVVASPEGTAPHTIIQTLQKGWMIQGKVVRPAKVVVTE